MESRDCMIQVWVVRGNIESTEERPVWERGGWEGACCDAHAARSGCRTAPAPLRTKLAKPIHAHS